jgi:hypothetical protein
MISRKEETVPNAEELLADGEIAYINPRVADDPDTMPGYEEQPCRGCGEPTWVHPDSLAVAAKRGTPVVVCLRCAGGV